MFIGRETELKFLNDKYSENGGQLIVLYGRRRVGKTETLREFCKGKPHVFFSCTQTTDPVQLRNFSARMLREDIPAKSYITEFTDWERAFRAVRELPYGDRKKLLVIDEFPYMCRGNKSIPSILQNLWDAELRDANVMIILCGSAMSFIEKELLAEKNPLYGRATGIYKMKEMGFYDAAKFFPDYSDRDKVLAYAVLGGIPHYLRQWNPGLSIDENIKRNILTKGCILYSEVEFLLHQELRETPIYNSIIEAVALGNTKLNDISQKSLVEDTSKTSVYLKNLIELGIVEREFSVDAKTKEQANSGRGAYRLTDNFFRFWYAFGFANFSQLEDGDVDGVYEYVVNRLSTSLLPLLLRIFAGNLFVKCRRKTSCLSVMQRWDVGLERLRYETRKQLPDCGQQRRRLTYSVLTEGQRNIWWVNVNSKAYRFPILSTVTRWQSFLR